MQNISLARLARTFKVPETNLVAEWLDHEPLARTHYLRGQTSVGSFSAWAEAVKAPQNRPDTARNHPAAALRHVLIRYGSFTGATTSGVEQSFSLQVRIMQPSRDTMNLQTELDETRLHKDLAPDDIPVVLRSAQRIWDMYFPRARRHHAQHIRIDTNRKRKSREGTETEFIAKRRQDVGDAVAQGAPSSFAAVAEAARERGAPCWTAEMTIEEEFQDFQRIRAKLDAFNDGVLLPHEVTKPLGELAQMWATDRKKRSTARHTAEEKLLNAMQKPPIGIERGTPTFLSPDFGGGRAPLGGGRAPPDAHGGGRAPHDYLAKLQSKCRELGLCLVDDRSAAQLFIVKDAAAPGQRIRWTLALQGGMVTSPDYLSGAGPVFVYIAAITSKRYIWATQAFRDAHQELYRILTRAASHPNSQWTLLGSLESFLAFRRRAMPVGKEKQHRPLEVLGLVLPVEKTLPVPCVI